MISDCATRTDSDIGATMLSAFRDASRWAPSETLNLLRPLGPESILYRESTLCFETVSRYGADDAMAVIVSGQGSEWIKRKLSFDALISKS